MRVLAHLTTAGLLALAAWAVHRDGGAEDPVPAPPPALSNVKAAAANVKRTNDPAYEIDVRLTERLGQAHLDVPNLRAGEELLRAYWRKMPSPWSGLDGQARRLALSVALATGEEEQHVVPLSNGTLWTPDVHKWNMSEGSFDQREAIFAPTPATIAFALTLPTGARLELATAIVDARPPAAPNAAVTKPGPARRPPPEELPGATFTVSLVDGAGSSHEVWKRPAAKGQAQRWIDASIDLSAYGGQEVELRLSTRPAPTAPGHPPVPALALWGNPVVLAHEAARVPYNVLFIVVDALRSDAIASFHDDADDAVARAAPHPPEDALLPRIDGLTPAIDGLGTRGVRFMHAWSSATWTRPGTLALLAGARSGQLGGDPTSWTLGDAEVARFYASDPPLLPLLLRRQGVETRAFVNNYFIVGYAQIGLDMGFERVDDERYRTRDTAEITARAVEWLKAHKETRFFAFCNFNSPHSPWDPPARMLARVPPPPRGPATDVPRLYLGEAAKDDEAIGTLLKTLDDLGLRQRTIVVVTADHGETLSMAHVGTSGLDDTPIRYHHTASAYEETARIPILVSLPGALPEGQVVKARVRSIDIAPTILELEGLEPSPAMTGKSLVGLARGGTEPDERVVVTEGRSMRAILAGSWHLVVREGKSQTITDQDGNKTTVPEELFDLSTDPGERVNLAKARPEVVAEMRARLEAALQNVAVVGSHAAEAGRTVELPRLALRFAGAGQPHRVSGTITVLAQGAKLEAKPVGVGPEALRVAGPRLELAFSTLRDAVVGVDLRIDPPGASVRWDLSLDDKPWPEERVFGGPFGLAAPSLRTGMASDEAREAAYAPMLPTIDPATDMGLFVARERRAEASTPERASEGAAEVNQLLEDWGYARASGGGRGKR